MYAQGGTPEFVAPELLLDPETYAEKGCGPSIDIWAAGVIMYYLLCGKVAAPPMKMPNTGPALLVKQQQSAVVDDLQCT
jgi:serine/threonine protein kinase